MLGANFALRTSDVFRLTGIYNRHGIQIPSVRCLRANLTDRAACHELLGSTSPSLIFHFAALTQVDWCEDHPEETRLTNYDATAHLAEWAGKNGCLLVYLSTDSVFDGVRGNYRESDVPRPINTYARTKLEGEQAVRDLAPEHLIVRANLFGWNAQPKVSLAEWVLDRYERGEGVPGFTDSVFAPLLVNTLSDWILDMVNTGLRGTWHLASAAPMSKYEFARELGQRFGYDPEHCIPTCSTAAKFRAARPRNTALDASRLAAYLGRCLPSLVAEIDRFKALKESGFRATLKQTCQ